MRAWRFFHHFRAGSNSRAWLYAILQNNFRNHWRKRELERSVIPITEYLQADFDLDAAAVACAPGPEREVGEHLTGEAIASTFRGIPESFRSALVLADPQELAYDEAAAALRVPIGTVKSRVSRGRAMIRHALQERDRLEGPCRRYPPTTEIYPIPLEPLVSICENCNAGTSAVLDLRWVAGTS